MLHCVMSIEIITVQTDPFSMLAHIYVCHENEQRHSKLSENCE